MIKSEHRASIRGAIIVAAIDLAGEWTTEDDQIMDAVDAWLASKDGGLAAVTSALANTDMDFSPPPKRGEIDD